MLPTYERGSVLIDTLKLLLELDPRPDEILVVDQTREHPDPVCERLREWESRGRIRWIRLNRASIPGAMNVGLREARSPVVLFLDDDIVPSGGLVSAHLKAHALSGAEVVVGQVLQPGEEPGEAEEFRFSSDRSRWIEDVMAGNLSVRRDLALRIGGFDENFVRAGYRFESEFAKRARDSGMRIRFEPRASIRHLRAAHGGTRAYGGHLRTIRPGHSVGAHYFVLRTSSPGEASVRIGRRLLQSVTTRHHLSRPWWIPATLVAETWGLLWAVGLAIRGPRLLEARNEDE